MAKSIIIKNRDNQLVRTLIFKHYPMYRNIYGNIGIPLKSFYYEKIYDYKKITEITN